LINRLIKILFIYIMENSQNNIKKIINNIHTKRKGVENKNILFKLGNINFNNDKLMAFSSFVLVIFFMFYKDKSKRKKLFELFYNKSFVVSALIALVFSIYTLYFIPHNDDGRKLSTATKHAIIGFLIGMLHHFEFQIGPFWFIWLASYYLDMNE